MRAARRAGKRVDVATNRVVIVPRDAARLGIDLADVPIARLVRIAIGAGAPEPLVPGGRRFGSAYRHALDLRAAFSEQPSWQPAVLIHAGAAPAPRWPAGERFATVTIDWPEGAGRAARRRARREVHALVGADAARRGAAGWPPPPAVVPAIPLPRRAPEAGPEEREAS